LCQWKVGRAFCDYERYPLDAPIKFYTTIQIIVVRSVAICTIMKIENYELVPFGRHGDETPLLFDDPPPPLNYCVKSTILLMYHFN
jgi:hypothetical protein